MNAFPSHNHFRRLSRWLRQRRSELAAVTAASILACSYAEPSPEPSAQSPDFISLQDAIAEALTNNLGIKVQRINPTIEEENVTAEDANFDPTIYSRASLSESKLDAEDQSGDPLRTTSDSRYYSAGVSKLLTTGAEVSANASLSRSDGSSYNSDLGQFVGGRLSERASLSLQITQPLLRNRGRDVNLAPYRRAKSQERVARYELRNAIADLLEQTEIAYWRLADAYTRRELSESNLKLANSLLEESRERERLGLVTRLDVLQAEANLAQRKEEIIRAEQAITEAADVLHVATGALDDQLSIYSKPEVEPLPPVNDTQSQFEVALQTALDRNFDTAIQEEILEQLEQDRLLAKNNNRPQVDVALAGSYNGLSPKDADDAFQQAFDRRGDDWNISLSFNLPWGRRASTANLRKAELRLDQAEIQLAAVKQDLLRSVRTAWRNAQTVREQLRAATQVVTLQQATYEQQQGLYEEGLSTIRQLLEAQTDLDNARLALFDARLSATESDIHLARVEGTLLERNQISWDQAEADAAD